MRMTIPALAVSALLLAVLLPLSTGEEAQGPSGLACTKAIGDTLEFSQAGDATRRDSNGSLEMTSGILYYLNITLAASSGSVAVTLDDPEHPAQDNVSHYYSFSYLSTRTPAFQDDTYDKYIQPSKCIVNGAYISFAFGVHANINPGLWTMNISSNGAVVHSEEVSLEMGRVGIGISTPTFNFKILPFEAKPDAKCNPSAFTVWNMGNIVSKIIITFDQYSSYLEATNRTGIFGIESSRSCEVIFDAPSLFPQKKEFKGHAEITGTNFITVDMVNFIPNVAVDFDIVVEVCREGYEILDLGTAAIQYKRMLEMKYGDQLETDVFVTGTGNVSLDISAIKLKSPSISIDPSSGTKVNGMILDLNLNTLGEKEEYHIVFRTKATMANTVAYLNYTMDTGMARGTASTKVYVQADPNLIVRPEEGISGGWIAAIIILLLVAIGVGFVLYQARQKGKEDGKKDGGEKGKEGEKTPEPSKADAKEKPEPKVGGGGGKDG